MELRGCDVFCRVLAANEGFVVCVDLQVMEGCGWIASSKVISTNGDREA
jgi:hypothetical protein